MIVQKRKTKNKVFAVIMVLMMLLGVCIPNAAIEADAATATVTYTGKVYSYNADGSSPSENMHGKFTTNIGSGIDVYKRQLLYQSAAGVSSAFGLSNHYV